jgi:hypothetical protein
LLKKPSALTPDLTVYRWLVARFRRPSPNMPRRQAQARAGSRKASAGKSHKKKRILPPSDEEDNVPQTRQQTSKLQTSKLEALGKKATVKSPTFDSDGNDDVKDEQDDEYEGGDKAAESETDEDENDEETDDDEDGGSKKRSSRAKAPRKKRVGGNRRSLSAAEPQPRRIPRKDKRIPWTLAEMAAVRQSLKSHHGRACRGSPVMLSLSL